MPAAAWAGVVVLGNGDVIPFPGGSDHRWPGFLGVAAILVAVILVVGGAVRRISRVSTDTTR